MISKQLKIALTDYPSAKDTIDAINEICEYPNCSWIKSMLNDIPISIVSEEKMLLLLEEINIRERKAFDKTLHIYKRNTN